MILIGIMLSAEAQDSSKVSGGESAEKLLRDAIVSIFRSGCGGSLSPAS